MSGLDKFMKAIDDVTTFIIGDKRSGSERRTDYKETDVSIDRQVENYVKKRKTPGGVKKSPWTGDEETNTNETTTTSSPIFNIKKPNQINY